MYDNENGVYLRPAEVMNQESSPKEPPKEPPAPPPTEPKEVPATKTFTEAPVREAEPPEPPPHEKNNNLV